MSDDNPIRITSEDVDRVILPESLRSSATSKPSVALSKSYGTLASSGSGMSTSGSFFLRSWVYLGISGIIAAFIAWATYETFVVFDANTGRSVFTGLAVYSTPWVVVLMCLGFAGAESLVEHSAQKFLVRAVVAIGLGAVLGLIFDIASNYVFRTLRMGLNGVGFPLLVTMTSRSIAWAVFGVTSGLVYGLAGRSAKKCAYGVVGGVLGAALGGLLFDPIGLLTGGGGVSRAVGESCFGLFTGISIGLVESALKDRWLYVSSGPLAGKQFVLGKERTVLGSQQSADIYLFKDPSILPTHAVLTVRDGRLTLIAAEPVLVNGIPVQETVVRSRDQIKIGRYTFDYQEKRQNA